MTGIGPAMLIVSNRLPVPPALSAVIVATVTAAEVGVPVIAPVAVFTINGEGTPAAP